MDKLNEQLTCKLNYVFFEKLKAAEEARLEVERAKLIDLFTYFSKAGQTKNKRLEVKTKFTLEEHLQIFRKTKQKKNKRLEVRSKLNL